jgi:cilia- and flagella-associated protein 65
VNSAKPASGIVPAENFQLIELRFAPTREGMHRYSLPLIFNNSEETSETVHLMGLGQVPKLTCVDLWADSWHQAPLHEVDPWPSNCQNRVLDVGAEGIFIKPTAVGLLSSVTFRLQNQTRVPLIFNIPLSDRLRENFTVAPSGGRLKGKETIKIQVRPLPRCTDVMLCALPVTD